MKTISEIQKELQKKSRDTNWKREVKKWNWDAYLQQRPRQKITTADFSQSITSFEGALGSVKIHSFAQSTATMQKKCLSMLADQKRLEKSVMLQQGSADMHLIIEVKSHSDVQLAFDNSIFLYWSTIFIIIGTGATVHIVDTHQPSDQLFGASSALISVGKNTHLTYDIKLAGASTYQSHYSFFLESNARLTTYAQGMLSGVQQHTQYIRHMGSYTKATATWLVDSKQNAKLYSTVINEHVAQHTTADVVVRAVGRENAQFMFDGWIDIGKKALDTNSYLQQDVLLTSEKAIVRAVPNLEILTNDVRASHGATLGMVDEVQMRYLQSRGLSAKDAESMLVAGFLKVDKIKMNNNI